MSRQIKAPEERRKELMMVAYELFMANGYEETSVNSIVEKVEVAKGTFYHYFKSKEDILEAILTSSMEKVSKNLSVLVENQNINPWEKLSKIISNITFPQYNEKQLANYIPDRKDNTLHMAMENKFYEVFYPIILNVIKDGIEKKEFIISYPEEITEILIRGIQGFMHNHMTNLRDPQYAMKKIKALEELFTKVLGNSHKEFKFI